MPAVKTEMLLWPKVCCLSWMLYTRCYCELVTNVVYNNFQDILVPLGAMYSALGNKKFLKSISIHFNCSFMQLKQQTFGHNNISLLAVWTDAWIISVSKELDDFIASSSSSTQSVVSGRHFFTQEKLACLVEVSVIEQILQKFSEIVGNWACWNSVYELASFFSTHAWEPGSEGSTSSQQKSSMSLDLCFIYLLRCIT